MHLARTIGYAVALSFLAGCNGTPPMAPLTASTLQSAERCWQANGADSYHLVVRVRAPRFEPAVYDVVVNNGKLTRVERDGQSLGAQEAGRHDYSMSGLFALLRGDLHLAGAPPIGDNPPIDLRTHFDPETGRLVRYRRTVGSARRRVLLVEVLAYHPFPRASGVEARERNSNSPRASRVALPPRHEDPLAG